MTADRLTADPAGHYPYKHDEVRALVDANPAAGPEGPNDNRARVTDFISREIADATLGYVEAQAAYAANPRVSTLADYHAARDVLVAARQAHRANREGMTVVAVAKRAG